MAPISLTESLDLNTLIANGDIQRGGVTIGPSSIALPNGSSPDGSSYFVLPLSQPLGNGYNTYITAEWDPYDDNGVDEAYGSPDSYYGASTDYEDINADAFYGAQPNAWTIATAQAVPEPATLSLLCSALLGLGAVHLRRRAKG